MRYSFKNLFGAAVLAYIFIVPITFCSSKKKERVIDIPPSSDSGSVVLPSYDTAPGADVRHIPQQTDPKPDPTDKFEALSCGDLAGTWTVTLDSSNKGRKDEFTFTCMSGDVVSIGFGKSNNTFKSTYPAEAGVIQNSEAKFLVKTLDHSYTINLNKQDGKIVGTAIVKRLGTDNAAETHSVQLKKKK